ncbi:MAG: MFS transporter [Deltaproteobacteria bacterium]|nr:MFS transporter [Deltaproteobacteria bacterium]
MIRGGKAAVGAISEAIGFLNRQPRDWKITATRTSVYRFFYQMVLPYLSIFTIGLGASGTQLGIVNSVGMAAAALLSPFTGWILDNIGPKKIYLVGIGLLAISWLIFGIAQSWTIIIIAMLAYWVGFRTSTHGCAVVCGNSLATEDRATAMSCCETLAAGFLGIGGPMLGAWLVATFGGVNVSGIRPLFFISFIGTIATFFLVLTQLSNRNWGCMGATKPSFLKDLSQIFKPGRNLKRFIIISVITQLPMGMIIPFTQPFAYEVKGANEFVLGAMVTGFALTPLILGIPAGRLADRIGRKSVIFLIAPVFWASNFMLLWAPNSFFLIGAGVLQGSFFINAVITSAMQFELVPAEHMGRWIGILGFFRMLASAVMVYLAGVIWDDIGPHYVFLIATGLDLFIRIPLLMGMPETLRPRSGAG